jgi:hypothetical protein
MWQRWQNRATSRVSAPHFGHFTVRGGRAGVSSDRSVAAVEALAVGTRGVGDPSGTALRGGETEGFADGSAAAGFAVLSAGLFEIGSLAMKLF